MNEVQSQIEETSDLRNARKREKSLQKGKTWSQISKYQKNWCPIWKKEIGDVRSSNKVQNPKKESGNSGLTPEAPALAAHPSLREHGRELVFACMIRIHLETYACHICLEFSTDNSKIRPQIRDWIHVQFNFFFWPFSFLPLQSPLFPLCVRLFKFVCLFVVINPKNPYFVSRPGLKVNPLVYPLGPRSSSCGPTKGTPLPRNKLRANWG